MSLSPSHGNSTLYDIKGGDLPLMVFHVRSHDVGAIAQALQAQLTSTPGFFDRDATLLDFEGLPEGQTSLDLEALVHTLRSQGLWPVACRALPAPLGSVAQSLGLAQGDDARVRRAAASAAPAAPVPAPAAPVQALVLDKPLRSGQQCYAKGRDLVVLAAVNPGAEVIADGHIHVYAPLRGKAMAGARGNTEARIFALAMDPELISIAGVYRTSEQALPDGVRGQAAQVHLHSSAQGDKLRIERLQ